jgi:hypothetical protein
MEMANSTSTVVKFARNIAIILTHNAWGDWAKKNPNINLICKKENEKKRKTALQYRAATGPSTVVVWPARPGHGAVVVARDHWGVVRRVAARDRKRVVSAASVDGLSGHGRRMVVLQLQRAGSAGVVVVCLLPGGGAERALDAAASGHAPAGRGVVAPLVVWRLRDDDVHGQKRVARLQRPQLHDLRRPDLVRQLLDQLHIVHVADHQEQQVVCPAGHRNRLNAWSSHHKSILLRVRN